MDNINNLIKSQEIDVPNHLTHLKDTNVIQIWDEVSSYIEKFMQQSKGIAIPAFGTFSFVQKKIDVGNNKYILTKRPVFAISEKFAQTHGLKYPKYPVNGSIPVHPLNYTAIANETAFKRDDIDSCVRHVLQVFNRSVASRKNVEFTFTGIGKLQIKDYKVKMRFFKEFVNVCDGSGKVVDEMQNRQNTLDSVMSRNEPDRPHSKNTCILPRINSRVGVSQSLDNLSALKDKQMETIDEDFVEEKHQQQQQQTIETNIEQEQNQDTENRSIAPVASLYSSEDNLNYLQQHQTQKKPQSPFRIPEPFQSPTQNGFKSSSNYSFGTQQQPQQLTRPSPKTLLGSLPIRQTLSAVNGGTQSPSASCGHHNAGQELCYLCHQKTRRNIPIYLNEERKQKEEEEEQLLQQYQTFKNTERQIREDMDSNVRKDERAKMDAFNLGMADAIKARKLERPKTSDISRSFIFRKRVRTPPKYYKQQDLAESLTRQIEFKANEHNVRKQEQEYVEKMEQLKLAENLVCQREAYLRDKFKKQQTLKEVLDSQIANRAFALPKHEQDTEVFGVDDMSNERLRMKREQEREVFEYHKNLVEQRKREELLKQAHVQENDYEVMERVKQELKNDRAKKNVRMTNMRKDLESNWRQANDEKRQRDAEERHHRLGVDGGLVHEQCDKYKRCAQCERKLENLGESNIWSESRYVPGCRVMV